MDPTWRSAEVTWGLYVTGSKVSCRCTPSEREMQKWEGVSFAEVIRLMFKTWRIGWSLVAPFNKRDILFSVKGVPIMEWLDSRNGEAASEKRKCEMIEGRLVFGAVGRIFKLEGKRVSFLKISIHKK